MEGYCGVVWVNFVLFCYMPGANCRINKHFILQLRERLGGLVGAGVGCAKQGLYS